MQLSTIGHIQDLEGNPESVEDFFKRIKPDVNIERRFKPCSEGDLTFKIFYKGEFSDGDLIFSFLTEDDYRVFRSACDNGLDVNFEVIEKPE